jgi:hypothetical protein
MGMKDLHDQMSAKPQDHFHLYRRKDILAGMAGKNILLLDRDRMRFNGNDKALIQYIVKYYNKSTLIYSGKAAKNIASSIQAVDSTFCMKEYNRETIKLCLNVLDKTIASGE